MIYKLNMFLREWEGYDKVYNFFKEKLTLFSFIKAALYFLALVFCFFNHSILLSTLRVVLYSILFFLEYFLGCVWYEKEDKFTAILSYSLMVSALFIIILYSVGIAIGYK